MLSNHLLRLICSAARSHWHLITSRAPQEVKWRAAVTSVPPEETFIFSRAKVINLQSRRQRGGCECVSVLRVPPVFSLWWHSIRVAANKWGLNMTVTVVGYVWVSGSFSATDRHFLLFVCLFFSVLFFLEYIQQRSIITAFVIWKQKQKNQWWKILSQYDLLKEVQVFCLVFLSG